MKKLNIAVLDYSGGTVSVYENVEIDETQAVNGLDESDIVEQWLSDHTDHHLSNCEYMFCEHSIEIETRKY